jgi:hypothetical protein
LHRPDWLGHPLRATTTWARAPLRPTHRSGSSLPGENFPTRADRALRCTRVRSLPCPSCRPVCHYCRRLRPPLRQHVCIAAMPGNSCSLICRVHRLGAETSPHTCVDPCTKATAVVHTRAPAAMSSARAHAPACPSTVLPLVCVAIRSPCSASGPPSLLARLCSGESLPCLPCSSYPRPPASAYLTASPSS